MDARKPALLVALAAALSLGASYRTPNFIVTAPSADFAKQVGDAAEEYRRDLAEEWLGYQLKQWWKPCPITVRFDRGAGGVTSFNFDRGEVFGWNMEIQGPPDRILDSVLPHEVTHTIFATHFRQPLPRWADEGACSTVEHESERQRQNQDLLRFLRSGRSIRFSELFRMKQYPRDIHPLYAEGHSLATFLLEQGGKRKFIAFLETGVQDENWTAAIDEHYGFDHLQKLQDAWVDWVAKGSPPLERPIEDPSGVQLAATEQPHGSAYDGRVLRGQSQEPAPDEVLPLTPINRGAVAAKGGPAPPEANPVDPYAWNQELAAGGKAADVAMQDDAGWRASGASGAEPAPFAADDAQPLEVPATQREDEIPGDAEIAQAIRPQPPQSAAPRVVQWERAAEPTPVLGAIKLSESGRAVRYDSAPRVIRR